MSLLNSAITETLSRRIRFCSINCEKHKPNSNSVQGGRIWIQHDVC